MKKEHYVGGILDFQASQFDELCNQIYDALKFRLQSARILSNHFLTLENSFYQGLIVAEQMPDSASFVLHLDVERVYE